MKTRIRKLLSIVLFAVFAVAMASCESPQVYGSVGYSSYGGGGYHGGGRYGGSVRVGGRIY